MRGKPHRDEDLAPVIAALIAGMSVAEAARKYQLPDSTVRRLKAELGEKLVEVGDATREDIGDLILSHVHVNFRALDKIAKQTDNESWMFAQSAEGLANLYSKVADHTIRLLEAASAAGPHETG